MAQRGDVNTKPTIREVAAEAGVSVATASRVLNGHSATSEVSRKQVFEAAKKLKYTPNRIARSLRSANSQVIGVLVSDIRNPYFGELAHAIETALNRAGYAMFLGNSAETSEKQDNFLATASEMQVDGLVVVAQGNGSKLLDHVTEMIPTVFVDRSVAGYDVPVVDSNSYPGIEAALQHLKDLGHEKIGMVSGPTHSSTGVERRQAFASLTPKYFGEAQLMGEGSENGVDPRVSTLELLREGVTAILYAYTPDLWPCLKLFRSRGIRIPQDISVVAYDDLPIFEYLNPSFTTIRQEISTMGELSVETLRKVIAGKKVDSVRLETSLIVRESTSKPRTRALPAKLLAEISEDAGQSQK